MMAWITIGKREGDEVELISLTRDSFTMSDNTTAGPLALKLTEAEMAQFMNSGVANYLLGKYRAIRNEDNTYEFRIMTNHERMLHRDMLKKQAREQIKKNEANIKG